MNQRQPIAVVGRNAIRRLYRLVAHSPAARLLTGPRVDSLRRRLTATRMSDEDVVAIMGELGMADVRAWLFGGWACDALLGRRTRKHGDLDLVVAARDEALAIQTLSDRGFRVEKRFATRPWFETGIQVLDGAARRRVTLHPVDLDGRETKGWQDSIRAAAQEMGLGSGEDLFMTGRIAGHELPCLSPAGLLVLHTGYEPDDADRHDVRLLCSRFSLPAPAGYEA